MPTSDALEVSEGPEVWHLSPGSLQLQVLQLRQGFGAERLEELPRKARGSQLQGHELGQLHLAKVLHVCAKGPVQPQHAQAR